MELDRNLLEKINLLDDKSLRSVIENVAAGMGLDSKMASLYLQDMSKIKKTVSNLSQADLDRIQSTIGEENTQNLVEHIRREVKGE